MNQDLPVDRQAFNDTPHSSKDTRAAARLLAELRTRRLAAGSRGGGENEAADGLQEVIATIRRLLGEYPEARRFEMVALAILDRLIQPRARRWRAGGASPGPRDEARRRQLRRELEELRAALPRVNALLEAVRAGRALEADDLFMGVPMVREGPPRVRARRALQPIEGGRQGASQLFAMERDAVRARRVAAARSSGSGLADVSGLALSGGGIRSATFSLGLVQILARRGVLEQMDYLSTVSGGGYLGSFITSHLDEPSQSLAGLFGRMGQKTDTAAVRHLRNHSKYLTEGGGGGVFGALLVMILGVLTNLLALLPFVILCVLATWALRATPLWAESLDQWRPSGAWADLFAELVAGKFLAARLAAGLLAATAVAQLVVRPVVSFYTRDEGAGTRAGAIRDGFDRGALVLTKAALAMTGVAMIPWLFSLFDRALTPILLPGLPAGAETWMPLLLALVPLLSGPLASRFRDARVFGVGLRLVFVVSGPLFLLCLYLFLGSLVFKLESSLAALGILGAILLTLYFLWHFMDLNALSPHRFYRDRLAECYLFRDDRETKPARPKRPHRPQRPPKPKRQALSELGGNARAPYHLINACLNVPASKNPELRGRKGDFFCFGRHFSGSQLTGYRLTSEFEDWDPALDLGTAMAISGAALSSSMAVTGRDHLRFFLTLLNARLGYWLPNVGHLGPIVTGARESVGHRCTPGPDVLLCEMFGAMKEDDSFINLSDGGHIENLGVYELLRRRARFIVSVDGECDADRVFDALIKLIRYARIDLGVEIDIDLEGLSVDAAGLSRAHTALGKITYPDGSVGWLLYAKLSVTGDESIDVLDYRREQPSFPHQPTLDQLFDEKQFEAYRALGQHVAEELFREQVLLLQGADFQALSEKGTTPVAGWFEALVRTLRPESDPVFQADPTNLDGVHVGISISNSPDEPPERINEATLSVCKALIDKGALVVLGQDWRPGGIMLEIAKLAENDRYVHDRGKGRTAIVHRVLSGQHAQPPEGLPDGLIDSKPVAGGVIAQRGELTRLSTARICLGGKLTGFTGPIPGVLEEAWRAAKGGQPVLVSGCLGGVSNWLAAKLRRAGTRAPARKRTAGSTAPDYDGAEARRQKLPASLDALVKDLRKYFAGLPAEQRALHERLWETTTLEAAQAVMIEILDLTHAQPAG